MSNDLSDVGQSFDAWLEASLANLDSALAFASLRIDDAMIAMTVALDSRSRLEECHALIGSHPTISIAQKTALSDMLLDLAGLFEETAKETNREAFIRGAVRLGQASFGVSPLVPADETTWEVVRDEFDLVPGDFVAWRTRSMRRNESQ